MKVVKKKVFTFKRVVNILLCGFFIYFIVMLFFQVSKIKKKKEQLEHVNKQIKVWEDKNSRLASIVQVDDASIEKAAREKLGMCKEGEKIFVISKK